MSGKYTAYTYDTGGNKQALGNMEGITDPANNKAIMDLLSSINHEGVSLQSLYKGHIDRNVVDVERLENKFNWGGDAIDEKIGSNTATSNEKAIEAIDNLKNVVFMPVDNIDQAPGAGKFLDAYHDSRFGSSLFPLESSDGDTIWYETDKEVDDWYNYMPKELFDREPGSIGADPTSKEYRKLWSESVKNVPQDKESITKTFLHELFHTSPTDHPLTHNPDVYTNAYGSSDADYDVLADKLFDAIKGEGKLDLFQSLILPSGFAEKKEQERLEIAKRVEENNRKADEENAEY